MKRILREHWIIALIAAAYFAILCATAGSMGFTRDEGYYFKAGDEYWGWVKTLFSSRFFEAFSDAEIQRHMSYNQEHPAFIKLLFGISHQLFSQALGWCSPAQGYRITGFAFGSLSLIATYLLGLRLVNKRAGILAALMLASMPRYFYDAHLACFDVPITAMWTLSLVTFYDGFTAAPERRKRTALIAGLVFGVALSTKLNALFLPPIFVIIWLTSRGVLDKVRILRGPSNGLDLSLPRIPLVLISCAVLGFLVFLALWPHLWHNPFLRIGQYLGFHMRHEHYPILFFNNLLVKPPFPISFPFVMSYYTMPAPLVFLGTIGVFVSLYRGTWKRSSGDLLLVLSIFVPFFLIAMPDTPIFGGVKHWYNAMPGLCVVAARAAVDAFDTLLARFGKLRLLPAVFAVAPGFFGIAAAHPNLIGYYNELAGGYRGGAELGMQRGFWGALAFPMYSSLAELPSGSRVFFNRTNYDSYRMYLREGVFPSQIYYSNDAKNVKAAIVFEQAEHGEKEGETWSSVGTRPSMGVYQDGVTLAQKYVQGWAR